MYVENELLVNTTPPGGSFFLPRTDHSFLLLGIWLAIQQQQ